MSKKLSVVIPVYNFARFLPQTLDTIVSQSRFCDVELLILDGASVDETPSLIKRYQRYFPQIKYVRQRERGGIDRDMAHAVAHAMGDYCWLFSGDDLMLPGAIGEVLDKIQTGSDLYLTRHFEWVDDRGEWVLWPTVDAVEAKTFDLSLPADRRDYFTRAQNTEAFFSFIGGIIVRRSKWESVPINEQFVGSCWAHVARLFEIMPTGLSVKVLGEPYLKRRPDNDSFGSGSITSRFRLTIDGFTKIADHFFGSHSFEVMQVRRVLRNEYHPLNMWLGKFLCLIDPEREDIALMDRLMGELYGDRSWEAWKVRFNYARVTPQRFRKWQPDLSAKFDAIKASNRNN
jgi:abequosyltransferase